MSSKNVRDAIIALIVLAAGVWLLQRLGKSYIPAAGSGTLDLGSILTSVESMLNIFLIGIAILILILIPVWIAKHREEKVTERKNQEPKDDYANYR